MNQPANHVFIFALPWWTWVLCGMISLFLSRLAGDISENSGSMVSEMASLALKYAGIVFIVIGVVLGAVRLLAPTHT